MKTYSRYIIVGAIILALLLVLVISTSINKVTTIQLNNYSVNIATARLASAKNALDGTGEFTKEQCQSLGELAKKLNPSSDYLDCSSTDSIYLATPDTSSSKILTLSDENYTAVFTTDKNIKELTNYQFLNNTSAGFNKFGGRQ